MPLVAVLARGAGPGEIGALATAQTLPFLLLSIPIGLLADRVSKRRPMVAAEALRTLALVGLLIARLAGQLPITLLALLGFLGATGRWASASPHPRWCPTWYRASCWLRPILFTSVAWNIAWFVLQAACVPYAVRELGLSAGEVGFTLATSGLGMVLGALLAPRLLRVLPVGQAILLGPVVSVLASTTLRQTVTPGAMLGRVTAIFLSANMGARCNACRPLRIDRAQERRNPAHVGPCCRRTIQHLL